MAHRPHRPTRLALLLAAAAGLPMSVSALAESVPEATTSVKAPSDWLSQAQALTGENRVVEAKAVLERQIRSGGLDALDAESRADASRLLRRVGERLSSLTPIEASLQRAELAARNGDLVTAERHAKAVLANDQIALTDGSRAATVMRQVRSNRADLAPMIPDTLTQIGTDLGSGRLDQAKAGLGTVLRSGVELSPAQQEVVTGYQLSLLDVSELGSVGSAGVMQPGTVRRDDQAVREISDTGASRPAESAPAIEAEPARSVEVIQIDPVQIDAPIEEPVIEFSAPAVRVQEDPPSDLMDRALKAEAMRMLAEADQAYNEGQYAAAIENYTSVISQGSRFLTEDELSGAQSRLDDAQVRLRSNEGADLASEVQDSLDLLRQAKTLEYENELRQAREALSDGETSKARDLAARARLTITSARAAFSQRELDGYLRELDDLKSDIENRSEQIRRDELADLQDQREKDENTARSSAEREKNAKIVDLIDRTRALQSELKYEEALDVVEQLLFMDPINPTGLLLRDIISDILIYRTYLQTQRDQGEGYSQLSLDMERAMVPAAGIMDYPSDWPDKTFDRGEQSAYADPPENRRVLAELARRKVPANFNDNTFEDVLSFVETVTNVDLDIDWDSLDEIGIDRDTLLTLNFSPVPANVLLDRVIEKVSDGFNNAGWAVRDGILLVASDDALRKNTTLAIYDITDLLFEIPDYDNAPEIDLESVLQQGEGGQGQSPFDDDDEDDEEELTREERIQQILDIITELVDFEGWRDNGGTTGSIIELNGSLIITNTPKNHREIVGLLSKLREIRSMQINVETRFLLVNQDWFEQIGFDIDVVLNANNSQVRAAREGGVAGPGDPGIRASDFFDFGGGGLQRVVTAGNGGPIDTNGDGFFEAPAPQFVNSDSGFSPIGGGSNSLGLANNLAIGDFAESVLSAAPALGIAGQFLDDIQVDFLIQATQADRRTVQLTAPRLTFTNGQTANIFVVTQQAFVSDLQPIVGDSAVGFDPEVDVVSEGVTLLVEGVISADRRYVTMNVDTGVARVDGFDQASVSAIAGGQLVDSGATQSFIQLPTVTVTRVRTTVTVPDEGTVLLGGQRLITELDVETGVPVLSKIPIVSRFFTNRVESKEEQTLLILVKPTILIQTEEEERAHPGVLDAVRVGAY